MRLPVTSQTLPLPLGGEGRGEGKPTLTTSAAWPWRPFVLAALSFTLTVGALTGAIDLWHLRVSLQAVPIDHHRAHGFAQLFGFLGLFTMGMSLHLAPRFYGAAPATARERRLMTWLGIPGVVLLVAGRLGGLIPGSTVLSIIGGVFVFGAFGTWATLLLRFFRSLPIGDTGDALQRFLLAGALWWWLAAAFVLGWTLGQAVGGPLQSLPLDAVYAAALFGGTGSWLWGIFMRAGLCTLHVKRPGERAQRHLFVAWQGASGLALLAPLVPLAAFSVVAHVAFAAAVALLWWIVRPFSGQGLAAEGNLVPRAVQAGLCFVALTGALSLWSAASELGLVTAPLLLRDATRHAFTLGGATLLVLGFAGRMVPGFGGRHLVRPALYDAGVVAVFVGAVLRLFELAGTTRLGLSLAGASGGLAFLGVALVASSLISSFPRRARAA